MLDRIIEEAPRFFTYYNLIFLGQAALTTLALTAVGCLGGFFFGFRNRFAVVFQQYNLFQNMCALDNVTVAPVKVQRRPRREVEAEAVALLERVGLADKIRDYPDELSGGQQQRVAIARALALKPEVLLLDEVTASLDPELVSDVLDAIRRLAQEGMTMLIVSHEMGFVREISAKVVFMADGKVVEQGPPEAVFDDPRQTRTREFVSKILKH